MINLEDLDDEFREIERINRVLSAELPFDSTRRPHIVPGFDPDSIDEDQLSLDDWAECSFDPDRLDEDELTLDDWKPVI